MDGPEEEMYSEVLYKSAFYKVCDIKYRNRTSLLIRGQEYIFHLKLMCIK